MSNASPIGGGGRARTRSRSVSGRRRDAPHVAHRLIHADPEGFGHLPGDEIMARVRHRGRRSLRGRSREFRKWMPSSVSARNLPGATSQRSRHHAPSDLRDRVPSRGGTPRARAFGRPVGYTPHGPLARLECARQRAFDSDSSSGLEQESPLHLVLPRSDRRRCARPTDHHPDQLEPDAQGEIMAVLTEMIDEC